MLANKPNLLAFNKPASNTYSVHFDANPCSWTGKGKGVGEWEGGELNGFRFHILLPSIWCAHMYVSEGVKEPYVC